MSNNGKLTEAQELLLQKFPNLPKDDPIVEMAAWNALLEKKLDDFGETLKTLTQATLKQAELLTNQNQLIASQNLTLQKMGESNEALGQSLIQWKQGFSELQSEFKLLKNAIAGHGSTLQSLRVQNQDLSKKLDDLNLKLKSLETLQTLNSKVDGLTTDLKTLTTSVSTLTKSLNSDRWFTRFTLVFLLLLILGQYWGLGNWGRSLQSQIEQLNGNVNTALIRLKRLEAR